MPKINLILHFLFEIPHFKESAIWLSDSILAPNSRTSISPDMGLVVKYQPTTILVSILNYFQEKLMTKFSKISKKTYLGAIWALFAQIWAKMNFPGKKGSDIPITYHRSKNPDKHWTDEQTDRQRWIVLMNCETITCGFSLCTMFVIIC